MIASLMQDIVAQSMYNSALQGEKTLDMLIKSLFVAATVLIFSPVLVQAAEVLEGASLIKSSSFTGENDHTVSGKVEIVKQGDVYYLVLGEDFSFDGAPDPRLGFSNDDSYASASTFSGLNLDSGKQIYRLPATLDLENYDEITIWCEKFGVPLAEAKF